MSPRSAYACTLILLTNSAVRAELLPTLPLRELAVRADVVVVAAPVAATEPGHFRVRELLKGAAPGAGAEIAVEGIEACIRLREQPDQARVDAALLFLRTTAEGRFELIASGVRLHARDGSVWWPVPHNNTGRYHMVPDAGVQWDACVLRARSDAAESARVQSACGLADAGRRDRFLLEWVERHRHEFSNGREPAGAWHSPAVPGMGPGDGPHRTGRVRLG